MNWEVGEYYFWVGPPEPCIEGMRPMMDGRSRRLVRMIAQDGKTLLQFEGLGGAYNWERFQGKQLHKRPLVSVTEPLKPVVTLPTNQQPIYKPQSPQEVPHAVKVSVVLAPEPRIQINADPEVHVRV